MQFQGLGITKIKRSSHNEIRYDYSHGPDDRIRTCGILLPKQALYQTEPRPDKEGHAPSIADFFQNVDTFFIQKSNVFRRCPCQLWNVCPKGCVCLTISAYPL